MQGLEDTKGSLFVRHWSLDFPQRHTNSRNPHHRSSCYRDHGEVSLHVVSEHCLRSTPATVGNLCQKKEHGKASCLKLPDMDTTRSPPPVPMSFGHKGLPSYMDNNTWSPQIPQNPFGCEHILVFSRFRFKADSSLGRFVPRRACPTSSSPTPRRSTTQRQRNDQVP